MQANQHDCLRAEIASQTPKTARPPVCYVFPLQILLKNFNQETVQIIIT